MNRLLQFKADDMKATIRGLKLAHMLPINNISLEDGKVLAIGNGFDKREMGVSKEQLAAIASGGISVGDILPIIESFKVHDDERKYFSRGEVDVKTMKSATSSLSRAPLSSAITYVEVVAVDVVSMRTVSHEHLDKCNIEASRSIETRFTKMSKTGLLKNEKDLSNEIEDLIYFNQAFLYVEFKIHTLDIRELSVVERSKITLA